MTGRFLYLAGGPSDRPDFATGCIAAASIYALDRLDLGGCPGLLVPMHADQRQLAKCQATIAGYLDGGGAIVINGHVAHPFLPELRRFVPLERPRLADLEVVPATPHPVFQGIDYRDLSYRRGVAGFYGRGHNPPPPGAAVLNALAGGDVPLDWLWQRPGGGLVFMHAGNDIWMYGRDGRSASRLLPRLLDWLAP